MGGTATNTASRLEVLMATAVIHGRCRARAVVRAATHAVAGARATTYAAVLAQQRWSSCRPTREVRRWGCRRPTTDVSAMPETSAVRLSPSPAHSLAPTARGYCDFVGTLAGRLAADGAARGTACIRRW
jgi:hypothetical protein